MTVQCPHKLSPPRPTFGAIFALNVILAQFGCQIDEGDCHSLGLPLDTQRGHKTEGGGGAAHRAQVLSNNWLVH